MVYHDGRSVGRREIGLESIFSIMICITAARIDTTCLKLFQIEEIVMNVFFSC
jgi:hypothetical protein